MIGEFYPARETGVGDAGGVAGGVAGGLKVSLQRQINHQVLYALFPSRSNRDDLSDSDLSTLSFVLLFCLEPP